MTEQQLQKKIVSYIESLPNSYVIVTIATNRKGTPDIIACINGLFYAFEIKLPTALDTVTPIQKVTIEKIKKAGGKAYIINSVEQIKRILDETITSSDEEV